MVEIALRNKHLIVVVCLVILVIGGLAASRLPADLLPIYETPAVQIITFYPGMPPEVMERDITSRLERWTGQSVGISHQEGKSMLGVSIVKNYFREGISLETAMSQVSSYAMSDLYYLPPGTIPPMVMPFDPTATLPLCLVSVSSPTMSEKELYDVAYFELRNRLQSIQGVIAPAVYGGVLRRILAYVDREKLEVRGLSPMDVVRALRESNVFIPAGNIKVGRTDFQLFSNAMPVNVEDLNLIPITVRNGEPILIRDIGRVEDSHQIQSNVVRVNGRRQVYIPIYRQPGANTIEIVSTIRTQLDHILQRLREMDPRAHDMALEVVLDQSVFVRKSIEGLQFAGILGALLAALVVFLFLRVLRLTFIVVLTVPLAVLCALIGLSVIGETLNTMTLAGLALAIGPLIDQSIVVLENVVRHAQLGKKPAQAALDGTKEVLAPLLVAMLTFVVVFFPIVFLTGTAAYLFQPLAFATCFAIIAAWLLAITLVPAYCAVFMKSSPTGAHGASPESGGLTRPYVALLDRILHRPLRWIGAGVLAFLGALFLLANMSTELFPKVDSGQFTIYVRMPSGTRIELTEETVIDIENHIQKVIGKPDSEFPRVERYPDSDLQMLISNIGVLMDWPAAYTPNTGAMDAFLLVQLKEGGSSKGAFEYVAQLRRELREAFPLVEFAFDTGGMMTAALNFGEPAPLHIQISGSDLETSHAIAEEIARVMREVPGLVDVRIAQRMDYPAIYVEIDRIKSMHLGLTTENVIKNLVTATNSSVNFAPAFWIDHRNGNHYFIGAQYREEDLESLEDLRNIPITGEKSHGVVPLRNIAELSRTMGPAVINHLNITRVIDVYADVEGGQYLGDVVAVLEARLATSQALAPQPGESVRGLHYEVQGPEYAGRGYTYTLTGEVATMRESMKQLSRGLLLAIFLVYLVMVAQLQSFLDPVIVLCAVPLGLVGVVGMLTLTGTPLNIQSGMGIILMVGVVVQFSILLVDFANRRVKSGLSVRDAIREAGAIRLRPILMTSLAAVLALLPMAIGFEGGEGNIPLARAIIGAILGGAGLTLLIVPAIYVKLKRPSTLAV